MTRSPLLLIGMTLMIPACDRRSNPPLGALREGGGVPKSVTEWLPGDDVPGWGSYEYDCPLYTGANVAQVDLPDTWYSGAWFIGNADGYAHYLFGIADCSESGKACSDRPSGDPGWAYLMLETYDFAVADIFQKAGYYCEGCGHPDSLVISRGTFAIGGFADDEQGHPWVEMCLSRVRPDEVRGVAYLNYYTSLLPYEYFSQALVQYPFDMLYADHASWDMNLGSVGPHNSYHYMNYAEGFTYDNVWDWDAITDPAIREAVYERYTPSNWP